MDDTYDLKELFESLNPKPKTKWFVWIVKKNLIQLE